MLKIRLQRIGRRHDPHFRVIVTDAKSGPKSGKFVEMVGSYNAKLGDIQLKADRIQYWIGVGAQPTGTVHNMLVDHKIIDGPKRNVLPKKSPIVSETDEADTDAPAADATADDAAPAADADTADEPAADETDAPADEPAKEEDAPASEVAEEAPAETPAEEAPAE